MIDTSIYLHPWPFRRLPGGEPAEIAGKLAAAGVTEAWTGSFEAPLADDLAEVNTRLAADCRRWAPRLFVPFGCVNPALPGWERELRRCAEEHRMPGLRLHPNYHGYSLDGGAFTQLLAAATAHRMLVQVVVQLQDERTQHVRVRVPPVPLGPLAGEVGKAPSARVVISNASRLAAPEIAEIVAAAPGRVAFDFAMVEGVYGLKRLAAAAGAAHVVFGSFHPLFYFESALLKIREAALDPRLMTHENPARLLKAAGGRPQ